jgi:ribosomal protein S18 acetylase RimI-like enzyme
MTTIDIVRVTPSDIEPLLGISRQTFTEAFSADNTEENMQKYLAESLSLEKLSAEVNDDNSMFYFAVSDNKPTGYLKLNFGTSQTELKADKALEIERIYVLREYQGQKVGQQLFEKAMQVARQAAADYVWLGVWEHNAKAIGFYRKNGFVEFGQHVFRLGDDDQTDIMMKLSL